MNPLIKNDYSLEGFQLLDYQNQAITFALSKFNVILNLQPGARQDTNFFKCCRSVYKT